MAQDAPAVAKPRYSRDDSEFDRAIGFIDATFALALTLLITTLEIGDRSAWESLGSLNEALGAQFIAFAIAFVVISGYWLRHHRMVASFSAIDYPVIGAQSRAWSRPSCSSRSAPRRSGIRVSKTWRCRPRSWRSTSRQRRCSTGPSTGSPATEG